MTNERKKKWRGFVRSNKALLVGFILMILTIVAVTICAAKSYFYSSASAVCKASESDSAASPEVVVADSQDDAGGAVIASGPAFVPPNFADASEGYLFETADGQPLQQMNENGLYHPASTIKLATALLALRNLGPDYVFETKLSISGTLQDGLLTGNLYVSGNDPSLRFEHGVALARALNQLGIRRIHGFLVVEPDFSFNETGSTIAAARLLRDTLDARYRSCFARGAFKRSYGDAADKYSVEISWGAIGGIAPMDAQLAYVHRSAPLISILKALLCYSDNFMAERLGRFLGGPGALQAYLVNDLGISAQEVHVGSTSGLGSNWISPKSMMVILRALIYQLDSLNLKLTDLAPVAGVDQGTLLHRYTERSRAGTVVGKTGTMGQTQGGISALVGQYITAQGACLFVIFDRRGKVARFRAHQDQLVKAMQDKMGGPALLGYTRQKLAITMRPVCLLTCG